MFPLRNITNLVGNLVSYNSNNIESYQQQFTLPEDIFFQYLTKNKIENSTRVISKLNEKHVKNFYNDIVMKLKKGSLTDKDVFFQLETHEAIRTKFAIYYIKISQNDYKISNEINQKGSLPYIIMAIEKNRQKINN